VTAAIPASDIMNVIPGVVTTGGAGLATIGLFLSTSTRAPYGAVLSFNSAASVLAYFGAGSTEANAAAIYFAGFTNSAQKPGQMLLAAYATAARAAWLRGAAMGLTLAQLQALSGTLTITLAGAALTSAAINLAAATSFSNAATIIQAAFTAPGFTCSYDAIAGAFLFTSNTTGVQSIVYATGTLAASLGLTAATGAVLSQGVAADTPAAAMNAIIAQTQNWVAFGPLWAATDSDLIAFAAWNNGQNNRFLFVGWTADTSAYSNPDNTSPLYLINQANYSGTTLVWAPSYDKMSFVLGYVASVDYTQTRGRTVADFRSQAGLSADVSNQTIADQLATNGYAFYGAWATAAQQFVFLRNGRVSGPFKWIDSYVDQIWMNSAFQLDLMNLATTIGQIPYNADGYELIRASLLGDIQNALTFGAIRTGITLSESQKAYAQSIAGQDVSQPLYSTGWYLSVQDPGPTARANRTTPLCYFLYTDGQSVQSITLNSLMVQ